MADFSGYESHLSLPAAAYVTSLPKRLQLKLLDIADQIARQPFQIGDYRTKDASGREIENLQIDGFLFVFWVDHAGKEVRITEIVKI